MAIAHNKEVYLWLFIKGAVQRKQTGVKSGINQQLMISSCSTRHLFFIVKGPCPFKLKSFFSVLFRLDQ
jgi:hypothetical protein